VAWCLPVGDGVLGVTLEGAGWGCGGHWSHLRQRVPEVGIDPLHGDTQFLFRGCSGFPERIVPSLLITTKPILSGLAVGTSRPKSPEKSITEAGRPSSTKIFCSKLLILGGKSLRSATHRIRARSPNPAAIGSNHPGSCFLENFW